MSSKFRLRMTRIKDYVGKLWDVVIIGAGAAGVAAGIYSARYMLKTIVVSENEGGTLLEAAEIENYPGFPLILGPDLARKFIDHLRKYDVPILRSRVTDIIRKEDGLFLIKGTRGLELKAKTVILALGTVRRKLGVPGEEEFAGRGVSYCTVCDIPLFKGKVVAIVGGGDSALQGVLLASRHASKVYLIHRRDRFRAQPIYVEQAKKLDNVEFVLKETVVEIGGSNKVEWVRLRSGRILKVDGIFIEIGEEPPREFLEKIGLELDEKGFIKVREDMSTNIPGIFAAGDVTNIPLKQIVTAVYTGARAATSAYEYITKMKVEGR